jgi:hypothetical protein
MAPMEAIIVPCTDEKVWRLGEVRGSVMAKDAYAKPAFRAWRRNCRSSPIRFQYVSHYDMFSRNIWTDGSRRAN